MQISWLARAAHILRAEHYAQLGGFLDSYRVCTGDAFSMVRLPVCLLCAAGLANEKTLDIRAGEDGSVKVSKSRPKHGNKPASFKHSTVAKKRNFRRTAANVGKDVHSFRPDLKV